MPWPQSANPLRAAAALVQHAKIIIISFWLLPRLGFNSFPPPPLLLTTPPLLTPLTLPGNRLRYASTWTWLPHRRKRKRSQNATPCSRRRRLRLRSVALPSSPLPLATHPFTGCCYFSGVTIKFRNPFFSLCLCPRHTKIKGCNNVLAPLAPSLCHASSLRLPGLLLLLLQTAAAAKHRQPFVVLNFPSFFLFFCGFS